MIDFKKNSFNLIRLIAALSVYNGHVMVHLNIETFPNAIKYFLSFFYGVPIFFFLSGFLLWNSLKTNSEFNRFFKKRVLRIYPELLIAVTISIISIIILYDGIIDYKYLGLFTITQSTFLQFWTPDFLRGFGCGTPNGSLWTICVMVQCYIVLWLMFKLFKHRKLYIWILIIIFGILASYTTELAELFLPEIIYKLYNQTFIPYFWIFIVGAFISEYFDKIIPILKKLWYIFIPLAILVYMLKIDTGLGQYPVIRCLTLFMAVISIAYNIPNIIKMDLSYGLYLYHMIIVNIFIELNLIGKWYLYFIVLLISLILSLISYYIIKAIKKVDFKTNKES